MISLLFRDVFVPRGRSFATVLMKHLLETILSHFVERGYVAG